MKIKLLILFLWPAFAIAQDPGGAFTVVDNPDKYLDVWKKLSSQIKKYPEAIAYKKLLEGAKSIALSMMIHPFTQLDSTGEEITFNSFNNKYTLIYLWESSSYPYYSINDNVLNFWRKFGSTKFDIIGISLETRQSREKWKKVIKFYNTPWIQVTDFKGISNVFAEQVGVTSVPYFLLVSAQGKIVVRSQTLEEIARILSQELP